MTTRTTRRPLNRRRRPPRRPSIRKKEAQGRVAPSADADAYFAAHPRSIGRGRHVEAEVKPRKKKKKKKKGGHGTT